MNALPTTCPECGSTDTGKKDAQANECFACEAFWYFRNSVKRDAVETVRGATRRRCNAEYEDALNNECFGRDSGW